MKTLIILVCVIVANTQAIDVVRELLSKAIAECKEKVNATPDIKIFESLEDVAMILQHKPFATETAKCLVTCLNKKFKMQTESGEFDLKAAKETLKIAKFISEEIYHKLSAVVETCLAQVHTGGNECEVGSSFFNCVMDGIADAKLPVILGNIVL